MVQSVALNIGGKGLRFKLFRSGFAGRVPGKTLRLLTKPVRWRVPGRTARLGLRLFACHADVVQDVIIQIIQRLPREVKRVEL